MCRMQFAAAYPCITRQSRNSLRYPKCRSRDVLRRIGRIPTLPKEAALRGVFSFDCEPSGGPYGLIAAPVVSHPLRTYPSEVADVARSVRLHLRFVKIDRVDDGTLFDALAT